MRGVIALLGSGETAPGMTRVHRELLARQSDSRAILLDTTFGFQENVPQMTAKLVDYFATSLRTSIAPVSFTSFENATEIERTIVRQRVREANYVFAGPGSPSYALAQWQPLGIATEFERVLESGGTLCFSSAAVVTLGRFAVPVYEIYKVGTAPFWLDGLNLLGVAGLNCVAIPHFDNNEGANYDTRYCYLGERRLRVLEEQLDDDVATLGIDEHTALVIDLESDTLSVSGRSHAHWRRHGHSRILTNGEVVPLDELRSSNTVARLPTTRALLPTPAGEPEKLAQLITCGTDVEESLATLVRLARMSSVQETAPSSLIDEILSVRQAAKDKGLYDLADQLRDALLVTGIEVHDTPNGPTWSRRGDQS